MEIINLGKSLFSSAEVTFWNILILVLSSLSWLKYRKKKVINRIFQTIAWASMGLLIGLIAGYSMGL